MSFREIWHIVLSYWQALCDEVSGAWSAAIDYPVPWRGLVLVALGAFGVFFLFKMIAATVAVVRDWFRKSDGSNAPQ